jgi:hypothetical protein
VSLSIAHRTRASSAVAALHEAMATVEMQH